MIGQQFPVSAIKILNYAVTENNDSLSAVSIKRMFYLQYVYDFIFTYLNLFIAGSYLKFSEPEPPILGRTNLSPEFVESTMNPKTMERNRILPFGEETDSIKATCLLNWLLDQNSNSKLLSKNDLLSNTLVVNSVKTLKASKNQSKLRRILERDLNLIESHISPEAFAILRKMQEATKKGTKLKYGCMKCDVIFGHEDLAWNCKRCLLWFHRDCEQRYPIEQASEQQFCSGCYRNI